MRHAQVRDERPGTFLNCPSQAAASSTGPMTLVSSQQHLQCRFLHPKHHATHTLSSLRRSSPQLRSTSSLPPHRHPLQLAAARHLRAAQR